MGTELANEKKNKKKGMRNSLIIHSLLLLIAFFYYFSSNAENNKQFDKAVVVDFTFAESSMSKYAHADEGKKKPKVKEVKKVEQTKPKEIEVKKPKIQIPTPTPDPTPTDPIVEPVLEEISDVVAVEDDIEVEDPEPEVIPEIVEEPIEEPVEDIVEDATNSSEESEEESAAESGDPEEASDMEGTNGSGKGEVGDGPGASEGDDGDEGIGEVGDGLGDYDSSGDGVFGRRVIYRNLKGVFAIAKKSGRIVAKVCINRNGIVTYAEINEFETSIKDKRILKKALTAMQGYRYQPDRSAPREQCGKLSIVLDIRALKKAGFKF